MKNKYNLSHYQPYNVDLLQYCSVQSTGIGKTLPQSNELKDVSFINESVGYAR
jgi:hypothetical protein